MALVLVSLILGAIVVIYLYLTRNYKHWQNCGIPYVNGALPGIGNMLSVILGKQPFFEYCYQIYNDNKNCSMIGIYNLTSPALIVREPELVKTVLQTKFTNFHENSFKIDPSIDPLLSKNPFFSYGEQWVTGRKRLTYAFSSMRLKILLESVRKACEKCENFLDRKLVKEEKLEIELKNLFSKYTAQVVAAAGFGVEGHCFDEEKEDLSFQKIGQSLVERPLHNPFFMILLLIPSLNKLLRISFLTKQMDNFFRTLISEIMEKRRTDGIPRNDFLQLMVDLEQTEGNRFDLESVTAHAMSFFFDGFDTSSSVLSFIGYQLAVHPEVQAKLREEIKSVLAKYDGTLTYDALKEMTYMDQVFSETQRSIPIVGFMSKVCTEECELRGSDGLVCRVQPKTEILIPVYGLQKDSRYWENPELFDPERFNPEKKQRIEKFAFLPFGEGPRICVGMRMALLQMKACISVLLTKYNLELSPKTQLPLKMQSNSILATPKGGLWVFLRKI